LVLVRSPDFYDEVPTTNTSNAYDDLEQMLIRAGSLGNSRLQSDTLRDLEGTLALAQERKTMTRTEHHHSFLNFAELVTIV
jgi:hypothetical protein